MICLAAGTYPSLTLGSRTFASDVTVQPASGAAVTILAVTLQDSSHLHFTGVGGSGATLTIGNASNVRAPASGATPPGYGGVAATVDPSNDAPTCSSHITFDYLVFVGEVNIEPHCASMAILIDHDRLDNIAAENPWEGRISVQALDAAPSSDQGITISNSHFAKGCGDGIQTLGKAYMTHIGPGNEFTNLPQANCAPNYNNPHVDPIQDYGGNYNDVHGNWFHDNGDGSGGYEAFDNCLGPHVYNNVIVTNTYARSISCDASKTGMTGRNALIEHNTVANNTGIGTDSNSTGNVVRNNVMSGFISGENWTAEDHNLCFSGSLCVAGSDIKANPIYIGGSSPSSFYGWQLDPSSPGYHAASDGKSMGIAP